MIKICIIGLMSLIMTGCMAIPNKAVRIEDRLWIENDYNRRLKSITVDYTLDRVLTRYGHTQMLTAGINNTQPVIFLHAMGLNLTSWTPNIEVLSEHFKVIALDLIGDQGRSIVRRDYPENITEYTLWLNDIIEILQLKDVVLVGCSMGGWIAHGYSIEYPEKVKGLVLISPAAGIPQKTKWMSILMKMLFTNDEMKLKKVARTLLGPYRASEEWLDYMAKASKDPKSAKLGMPSEFSNEQLTKTGAKTLLIIGEGEYIYKSIDDVVKRAEQTIPNISVKMIPEAGHLAAWDNPDFVNAEIISFIRKTR